MFKNFFYLLLTGLVAAVPVVGVADGKPVTVTSELEQEVLPAGQENTTVLKIKLLAAKPESNKRAPVNLALVMDQSGSMAGEKLARAKAAAEDLVKRLNKEDLISVVVYNNNVTCLVPAQSAGNAEEIAARIDSVQASGKSALFGGISRAAAELRKNARKRMVSRMILLSDGRATIGPSAPSDLERLGLSLRKEGISVSTIGLGLGYNEDLLNRISAAAGGNAYFAGDTRELDSVFKDELADILSVVAKDIRVTLTCQNGTRIQRLVNYRGRVRLDRAEVVVSQLYAGLPRYVLVEVQVPAGKDGENRQLAAAKVSFNTVLNKEVQTIATPVTVGFSSKEKEVLQSVNRSMQYEYNMNDNANVLNDSINLIDQGKQLEAIDNLNKRATQLRVQAERFNNGLLIGQADFLDAMARKLQVQGLSNRKRKEITTNNQGILQQQRNYNDLYVEPSPSGKGKSWGKKTKLTK